MNIFIISALAICTFNLCQARISDGKFLVSKLFNEIKIEKMEKLNVTERKKYFLKVFLENEEFREIALEEAVELGFMNRIHKVKDDFPCKNYSIPGSGKDVHSLTPLDIKVIAALGDSLTAGVGIDAKSIFGVLWEKRGKVFDIGGDEEAQTLVNLFRVFNPDVQGYSTKTTFVSKKGDEFNVGVSGDTSADLMDRLDMLLDRMKNDKSIDMEKDWKLITIFIGNNDICRAAEKCHAAQFTPELYKERLYAVLDKLKAEVPRAFVNLVTMVEVSRVHELNVGIGCSAIHLYECPGVAFAKNVTEIVELTTNFQTAVSEITNSDRYDDRDDFTVVTQPFFENTFVPMIDDKPDLSYFAPDCFHLSEKGHGQVALSLWNSLFQPISTKKRNWYVGETFTCPTLDHPYFATKKNSV